MINVALSLSDREVRNRIVFYLNTIIRKYSVCINYKIYENAKNLTDTAVNLYDWFILDINLHGYNGMEIARTIRKHNSETAIIFISSLVEFAPDGYEVSAYRFFRPSVSYKSFLTQLKALIFSEEAFSDDSITITSPKYQVNMPVEDICYIEVRDHRLYFHCENRVLDTLGRMYDVEKMVTGRHFYRIHQSFIVNLMYIKEVYANYLVLLDNERLSISRSKAKGFREAYREYIGY